MKREFLVKAIRSTLTEPSICRRPYISHLRLIPGVYIARAHTGTGKVFDVAEYTRITEK